MFVRKIAVQFNTYFLPFSLQDTQSIYFTKSTLAICCIRIQNSCHDISNMPHSVVILSFYPNDMIKCCFKYFTIKSVLQELFLKKLTMSKLNLNSMIVQTSF